MIPFMEKFPDLGRRETRSLLVAPGQYLPPGEYGFIEFYCNEPGCDCRRVTICVLRPDTGWSKAWATISYGWERPDFYRRWSGASDPKEMAGPSLDLLNAQSEYAPALLDLFRAVVQSDEYVARLKRHYRMYRDTVEKRYGSPKRRRRHVA